MRNGPVKELVSYITIPDTKAEIKRYSKVYSIHKYWARKPWYPIAECIKKYSKKGDLIVDMFMGSGVTGLESIIQRRNFVGYDLNPISIFIAENTFQSDVNVKDILNEFAVLKQIMEPIASDFYSVEDRCGVCGKRLMIKFANIGPKYRGEETAALFCYSCSSDRSKGVRRLEAYELDKSHTERDIPNDVPDKKFPKRFFKDRFSYKGILSVSDMYTKRNYAFLGFLLNAIKQAHFRYEQLFLIAFSNTVLHASKLKSENIRPLNVNNYWVPDDYFEENPWYRYLDRFELVLNSKNILKERISGRRLGQYSLHNKSCLNTSLDSGSVDYILTDPPYGDAIQYSELSLIWNTWLGFEFDNNSEVVINPAQNKSVDEFLLLLGESVKEAARILKDNKNYTLCFHNKEFYIWKGVLDLFKHNDFVLDNIDIVETKGNPYNANWAKFSPKTDLYLTFRKSKYNSKYNREHGINEFIRSISLTKATDNPSELYDYVAVNLIYDLYFNKYQLDVSGLNIKTIFRIFNEVKSGN